MPGTHQFEIPRVNDWKGCLLGGLFLWLSFRGHTTLDLANHVKYHLLGTFIAPAHISICTLRAFVMFFSLAIKFFQYLGTLAVRRLTR